MQDNFHFHRALFTHYVKPLNKNAFLKGTTRKLFDWFLVCVKVNGSASFES